MAQATPSLSLARAQPNSRPRPRPRPGPGHAQAEAGPDQTVFNIKIHFDLCADARRSTLVPITIITPTVAIVITITITTTARPCEDTSAWAPFLLASRTV